MDLKCLYIPGDGTQIGNITAEQLQFLIDHLEEEGITDQDYAITPMTLAYLEEEGGDPAVIEMLRKALGDREEFTFAWDD
ncbi:MAG: galactosyldiacylglycerol synthase [Anaerolineales bacterium]|nr:galactosyldiacylglycerol synthase [Anaerolineales bacterium]